MKKTLLFLCISCLLAACDSSDEIDEITEPARELKLSVEGVVYTNEIDYEFEILEGNGDYTISISPEEHASTTLDGTTVKLNLLHRWVEITVTDKEQKSESVTIQTTAESLVPHNYGLSLVKGDSYTMANISFGAGNYTIERIKGTSAEAAVDENEDVTVTALEQGNSYFTITDHRGSTAPLEVNVIGIYDLTESNIEITAVNDQVLSIVLMWGDGDWQFVKTPSSHIIDKVHLMTRGDIEKKYDILQVDTSKGDDKGSTTIQLKDKSDNIASITVRVEQ